MGPIAAPLSVIQAWPRVETTQNHQIFRESLLQTCFVCISTHSHTSSGSNRWFPANTKAGSILFFRLFSFYPLLLCFPDVCEVILCFVEVRSLHQASLPPLSSHDGFVSFVRLVLILENCSKFSCQTFPELHTTTSGKCKISTRALSRTFVPLMNFLSIYPREHRLR